MEFRTMGKSRWIVAAASVCLAACLSVTSQAQSYTFQNVQIVGGGFVDGIVAHPQQSGLFYARTDVGGAYRFNSSTGAWVPLLDWLTPAEWQYMGVESLAIDPNDVNMLYLAAGEYIEDWDGNGAILVSSNQGASFTTVPMPFRMGGNDNGRNGGERLQVDPNLGSVLLYGSYENGLWKSTNSGSSWSQVTSFPVTGATSGAGIIFVAFDRAAGTSGTATPKIFVGVSDTGTSSTGYSSLYETTNGGTTWSAVAGQPTGLYPTHGLMSTDTQQQLYITYSNAIGPNGMTSGQVWRYHVTDSYWGNITPPNPNNYTYGFGGLAMDAEQSGRLIVTTMDRYYPGDTLFLTDTANGTTTWNDVGAIATRNSSLSPWVNFGSSTPGVGNWMTAVVIDPFNQNHAMYGTGGTVWTTSNLENADTNTATSWTIGAKGIEETVANALMSPSTGPPLVSGVWDLGGFVHTSLTSSPAGGMSENPLLNKGSGLDYAKSSAATLVRVGYASAAPFGAYSTNSGSTWTPFGSAAGSTAGGGTVAISASGGTILWSPSDVAPSYSTNHGSSWTSLAGTLPVGVQVLSDSHSSSIFYALSSAGVLYASSNGGVSWYTANASVAKSGKLAASLTTQGDIWLYSGSGLWHSTNSGTGWSQVASGNVTAVTSMGLGKASGTGYAAMYMIGTYNGVTAIFRSTNEGVSWTQINGAATQWGATQLITGDPKTFGTVYIGTGGRGIIYGTSPN
jgi:hypothetical protein